MTKIRYYGHVGQRTGYGRAAEAMCFALITAGYELEIRPLANYQTLSFEGANLPLATRVRTDDELTSPDICIVHTLPLDCRRVLELCGYSRHPDFISTGAPIPSVLVAYTTWEGHSRVPLLMAGNFDQFDQVWVPSAHNLQRLLESRDILKASPTQSASPNSFSVHLVPHAYDPKALLPSVELADHNRYCFYYVGAWTGRKNPAGVVRAYAYAFEPEEDVELVLCCAGCADIEFVVNAATTGLDAKKLPAILFNGGFATDLEIAKLHNRADCFVTATRGEAWNFPAFDAMLAGRHVIAPRNMGHDDFLSQTSARLYRGIPMPAMLDVRINPPTPDQPRDALNIQTIGAQGLTSKTTWLEPDVMELAAFMRSAYRNRTRHIELGYKPAERYSYEAVGAVARSFLEAV